MTPRRRPGNRLVSAIVLLLLLVATSCSLVADDGPTLTLGAVYPLSGRQGPGGIDEARGAGLAVELANRRGGIQGRQLRLKVVDVDTGSAAPRAMEALKTDGIDVVLGTYGSTISAPASVAAHHNGMLLWETGAVGETAPDAGAGESFFRIAPSGSTLGRSGVAFVRDRLTPLLAGTPRRYAVAYVEDAYGRAVGLGAVDEVREMGAELAGAFPYDIRGFDARELVARIAETRPDVLFVSAYLDDGIALRRATIEAQIPLLASVGTSSSYCMPSFAAALGAGAVGLFASDKPDAAEVREDALSPEGREGLVWARDRYLRRFGEPMSAAALAGFANAWALVSHVLPAAPGLSAAEVAATARALKLAPGTLANGGNLDVAPPGARDAGENRAAVSVIWQWSTSAPRPSSTPRPSPPGPCAPWPSRSGDGPVTARPRPLVAGLGLAVVYVLVALVTPSLTGRPLLPLFDGFAPPASYNWVNPPPGLEDDNSRPQEVSQDVALDEAGSRASNAATPDGQAIVGLDTGSVPPNPPDTSVVVGVSPVDAGTLAPLPGGLRPEGNAYRVTIAYQPSGQAVTALATPGTIALTAAAPATTLLFSPDGSQWQEIEARPFGDSNGLFAPLTAPGLYLSASHNAARTPGSSGDGGGGSGGIVVALLILAILGVAVGLLAGTRRGRKGGTAPAGKGGASSGKGGGPPPKGTKKPNRPRR